MNDEEEKRQPVNTEDNKKLDNYHQTIHNPSLPARSTNSLRLFLGSSPIIFVPVSDFRAFKEQQDHSKEQKIFLSVVLEHKFTNFFDAEKFFLSPWVASFVRLEFILDCTFY